MKIALCLQYWAGDADQLTRTARLISAMQAQRTDSVDVILSVKRGAPVCPHAVEALQDKFKVIIYQNTRFDVGYPFGPNAQWAETMLWAYDQIRNQKHQWDYLFTTEPDIIPLDPDWLNVLAQWLVKSGMPEAMGVMHHDHLNGNAFFTPDFAMRHHIYGTPGEAWDMYHANKIMPVAKDCPAMKNMYRCMNVTPEELFAPRVDGIAPVFVHGIKDDSGVDIIINRYGLDLRSRLSREMMPK